MCVLGVGGWEGGCRRVAIDGGRRPLTMILDQSLSILTNFFASCGICLAMSPPMNTDSRLVHSSWTLTQSSRVSVALLSSLSLFWDETKRKLGRQGAE